MVGRLVALVVCAVVLAGAGEARAAPRLLVTGDSMIMFTDRLLQRTLHASGEAVVKRDVRVATGMTKPWMLQWPKHAARQARRHRPDVVIATMGANDVHPIGDVRCCGKRWVRLYAREIEKTARSWRRGGARRVYWLTLPIQLHARLEPVFSGVNAAVERARGIRVFDVRPIVNPGDAYHHTLETAPGIVEQIRYEDGVHLWWPGARLVADALIARLRADGVLRAA
jgi:hypothetical protein